jgi:selenocysteine-specific elongation factor
MTRMKRMTTGPKFVSTPDHVTPGARSPEGIALIAALDATPFAPPDDAITGADPALVRALVRDGVLVDVGGIVFTRAAVDRARTEVRDALHRSGSLTVGDVRAMLGTSRKYAVPMLEHFDREGVTRRRGDARIAGPGA